MKAVIPYRYDKDHGEELHFAIRSLVKYFTPLSEIIVVGDCPDWYTGTHIQCTDTSKRKEYSIYNKLMQVKGKVLYSNDDYYALQPFDEALPYYNGPHTCGYMAKYSTDKQYKELYRNCPDYWHNFDIHCPMVIDTTIFKWFIDQPIKTAYAHQTSIDNCIQIEDCKIGGNKTYEFIKAAIKDRPFFSSKENAKIGGMPKVLNELFPDKSKYEA
jgi:hypothetical protein